MIASRFRGPAGSANGGYTCGLLAALVDGPAEVTLRLPPPLERPAAASSATDERVLVLDGEALVAEARPAEVDVAPPEPPSFEDAVARPSCRAATRRARSPSASSAAATATTGCGSSPGRVDARRRGAVGAGRAAAAPSSSGPRSTARARTRAGCGASAAEPVRLEDRPPVGAGSTLPAGGLAIAIGLRR